TAPTRTSPLPSWALHSCIATSPFTRHQRTEGSVVESRGNDSSADWESEDRWWLVAGGWSVLDAGLLRGGSRARSTQFQLTSTRQQCSSGPHALALTNHQSLTTL